MACVVVGYRGGASQTNPGSSEVPMSDRIGDYRDPFWSARDKRIRKAHLGALGAAGRIDDVDNKIAKRRRDEYLTSCADDLRQGKARLLEEISALTVGTKASWHQRLEQLDLTSAGAADELGQLQQDVEWYRRMFETPADSWPTMPSLSGFGAMPSTTRPIPESRKLPINAVTLRFQREAEEREARNQAGARQLTSVASSLGRLIDSVHRYESARS
ncbi:MAG: hypothetical protein ACRDTF_13260 [Pseudonocardiaceae bacterium]